VRQLHCYSLNSYIKIYASADQPGLIYLLFLPQLWDQLRTGLTSFMQIQPTSTSPKHIPPLDLSVHTIDAFWELRLKQCLSYSTGSVYCLFTD
jgi:hypothetical protein